MSGRDEQLEYLPETAEGAQQDGIREGSLERRAGLSPTWVAVSLLAVVALLATVGVVRLGQLIDRTDSLIVEQQRATCYERLQWLDNPFDDHPEGHDLRVAASRSCEGDAPLVAFEDE